MTRSTVLWAAAAASLTAWAALAGCAVHIVNQAIRGDR